MPEQPATTYSPTLNPGNSHTVLPAPSDERGYVAACSSIQRVHRKRPAVVLEPARTVVPWLTVGKVVAWVCLVIVIDVALGRALQLAAENIPNRADTSEQAQPIDIVYARGACPALDRYANRPMTIDELHDLQDQLCPTLSEPQRTGNGSAPRSRSRRRQHVSTPSRRTQDRTANGAIAATVRQGEASDRGRVLGRADCMDRRAPQKPPATRNVILVAADRHDADGWLRRLEPVDCGKVTAPAAESVQTDPDKGVYWYRYGWSDGKMHKRYVGKKLAESVVPSTSKGLTNQGRDPKRPYVRHSVGWARVSRFAVGDAEEKRDPRTDGMLSERERERERKRESAAAIRNRLHFCDRAISASLIPGAEW